jgi:hypothetical protein
MIHRGLITKYLHILSIEQCLASSEPLTPPTPSPPSVCPFIPHTRGGGQYFGRRQTLDWPLAV